LPFWRDMIGKVVAFEVECDGADVRKNIVALTYRLTTLQVPHHVYVGPIEEVLLRGHDYDGKPFAIDELVTLYNLDFCNSITGAITTGQGRQRLRFEALREIAALQRRLYRKCGAERFVFFITVFDGFHPGPVKQRLRDRDLPAATRQFTHRAGRFEPANRERTVYRNTDALKAFVFTCIRDYLQGQNIVSVFLPPVSYMGRTTSSPMLHFTVVCRMGRADAALATPCQSAQDFLSLATLDATEKAITVSAAREESLQVELDPAVFVAKFPVLRVGVVRFLFTRW